MKRLLKILCVIFLFGCTGNKEIEAIPYDDEPSYVVLDSFSYGDDYVVPFNTTIKLEALRQEDLKVINPIFQETLQSYAKLFDAYHEYEDINNIFTINSSYGEDEKVILEEDLFDLIKEGINLTKLTDGKFNITIGTLFDLWKDKFSPFPVENSDPDEKDINKALGCVVKVEDIDSVIELDDNDNSIVFHKYDGCNDKVKIDVGAIAKGYAVEKTKEKMSVEEKPFLINIGSSSISTYVPDNEHKDWIIGVRNPYARVLTLYDYVLQDNGSFTTSGDDSNYFILEGSDGTIRHHILDTKTGYPNTYIKEATIFSKEKAYVSDALSTALFNCETLKERLELINKVEVYYDIDIKFCYFEEVSSEKGNLITEEDFKYYIMPSSISDNIENVEVVE